MGRRSISIDDDTKQHRPREIAMEDQFQDRAMECDSRVSGQSNIVARFRQNARVEFAPLQDEVILFHAPSNKFCVLNRTSSFIWAQLKEATTSDEIAHRLRNFFTEVNADEARIDVDSALREMLALGLIVATEGNE